MECPTWPMPHRQKWFELDIAKKNRSRQKKIQKSLFLGILRPPKFSVRFKVATHVLHTVYQYIVISRVYPVYLKTIHLQQDPDSSNFIQRSPRCPHPSFCSWRDWQSTRPALPSSPGTQSCRWCRRCSPPAQREGSSCRPAKWHI